MLRHVRSLVLTKNNIHMPLALMSIECPSGGGVCLNRRSYAITASRGFADCLHCESQNDHAV